MRLTNLFPLLMAADMNHSSTGPGQPGGSPDGKEPVQQLKERGVHGDNELSSETGTHQMIDPPTAGAQVALPLWIAEKFHWVQGAGGRYYLSPNSEFMGAIIKDAPKAQEYGYKLLLGTKDQPTADDSVERMAVADLSLHLKAVLQTLTAVDSSERELNGFKRWLTERATSNFVYCAITQFEIDNWAARSAAQGKQASDNENFGLKVSRRDEFALNGAVFHAVCKDVLPTVAIDAAAYEKQAKTLIYQQARMRTQELQNPQDVDAADQQARAHAVASSRAF